jgi:uncharacterized protein
MTVVDVHTHMPGQALSAIVGFDAKAFLALMDANGIDKAWVFTLDGLYFDPAPHNDRLAAYCACAPDRLLPFCTVHPRYPDAVGELRRCIIGLGMKGLKLHPWAQTISPMDDQMMDPIGDELAALGVPVVFHDGTPPESSPLQIAHFARRHPSVPVVLGHGGLHDLWKEAVYAGERCPNIYLSPSGTPPAGLRYAMQQLPPERFLFGTDAGFGDPYWHTFQLAKIRGLGLPPADEALVLGKNAERLLANVTSTA